MKDKTIEIIDVPQPAYGVAERRMAPFVRHAANMAQFGQLDLMKLACSAYLQGAYDAFEGMSRIKEPPACIIPAETTYWWPF